MDAGSLTPFLIFLIGVALLFDFLNGLHDAATRSQRLFRRAC